MYLDRQLTPVQSSTKFINVMKLTSLSSPFVTGSSRLNVTKQDELVVRLSATRGIRRCSLHIFCAASVPFNQEALRVTPGQTDVRTE
jgi:hypothetical protein